VRLADFRRVGNKALRERATDAATVKFGPNVESLHLADARFEGAKRTAAGQCAVDAREKEAPLRTPESARKCSKFFVKVLVVKREAYPRSILLEEFASGAKISGRVCFGERDVENGLHWGRGWIKGTTDRNVEGIRQGGAEDSILDARTNGEPPRRP
jgi:hypothetical protein